VGESDVYRAPITPRAVQLIIESLKQDRFVFAGRDIEIYAVRSIGRTPFRHPFRRSFMRKVGRPTARWWKVSVSLVVTSLRVIGQNGVANRVVSGKGSA